MELPDGPSEIDCFACGQQLHQAQETQTIDIPVAEECEEEDNSGSRHSKTKRGKNKASGKSKRALIAGSPPWAWAFFFYVFGALTACTVFGGVYLYQELTKSTSSETANVDSAPADKKPNFRPQSDSNTRAQQMDPRSNVDETKPIILPQDMFKPVPNTSADNGWPLYVVAEEGFSVSIPPQWRQVDLSPAAFDTRLHEMLKSNPQLNSLMGGLQKGAASTIKFYGIDERSLNTGTATNVNVVRTPIPPTATLDSVVEEILRQMKSVPAIAKTIKNDRLNLAAGECECIRWKMTVQTPARAPQEYSFTQLILLSSTDIFFLTMTTTSDREAQYAPTFEKICKGFRVIKKQDRD
jgi:hypothetical protein